MHCLLITAIDLLPSLPALSLVQDMLEVGRLGMKNTLPVSCCIWLPNVSTIVCTCDIIHFRIQFDICRGGVSTTVPWFSLIITSIISKALSTSIQPTITIHHSLSLHADMVVHLALAVSMRADRMCWLLMLCSNAMGLGDFRYKWSKWKTTRWCGKKIDQVFSIIINDFLCPLEIDCWVTYHFDSNSIFCHTPYH